MQLCPIVSLTAHAYGKVRSLSKKSWLMQPITEPSSEICDNLLTFIVKFVLKCHVQFCLILSLTANAYGKMRSLSKTSWLIQPITEPSSEICDNFLTFIVKFVLNVMCSSVSFFH